MAADRISGRTSTRGLLTREQVLQAARRLFADHGYHKTSVYDLFDRSGITKGAFFHHWKTKEELALAVFESMNESFNVEFFSIAEGGGKARDQLDMLLRRLAELSLDGEWRYGRIFARWCIELGADEEEIGPALHGLKRRWLSLWQGLIQKAQEEHDIRTDFSPENVSFLVASAICGVQLMRSGSTTVNSKSAYDTLRKALLT